MRYTGPMMGQRRLLNGRLILLAILAASMGALGMAYVAEVVFGLEPCILCLYQRVPYAITGVLDWLDENEDADATEYDAQREALERVAHPIMRKLYEQQPGADGADADDASFEDDGDFEDDDDYVSFDDL